jgi:hypothetical protein
VSAPAVARRTPCEYAHARAWNQSARRRTDAAGSAQGGAAQRFGAPLSFDAPPQKSHDSPDGPRSTRATPIRPAATGEPRSLLLARLTIATTAPTPWRSSPSTPSIGNATRPQRSSFCKPPSKKPAATPHCGSCWHSGPSSHTGCSASTDRHNEASRAPTHSGNAVIPRTTPPGSTGCISPRSAPRSHEASSRQSEARRSDAQ